MGIFRICKLKFSLFVLFSLVSFKAQAIEVFNDVKHTNNMDKFVFKEIDEFKDNSNELYGSILIDKITNDKNMIKGKSFKNSLVKFLINDIEYISSTDDEGNFILLLEEGLLVDVDQVNVRVCDYLGNELSNVSFVVHDILPPIDPKIEDVVNNSDNVIRGYGEPNSSIRVLIGDKEFTGYTLTNGSFEIQVGDSLRDAESFKIISYDCFNNYSNLVEKQVNDVIAPYKPSINVVDCDNNFVHGSGEANCEVVVSFDDKKYKSYIDENGNFYVYDDEGSIENTDLIKVKVVDLSGNSSEEVLFKVEKKNVGRVVLKSLDVNNKIIKDAMIKVNGMDDCLLNEDKVFNLNSEGNLFLEDLPFGNYELVIRYRTSDHKLEENVLSISLDEGNSEVEVLID